MYLCVMATYFLFYIATICFSGPLIPIVENQGSVMPTVMVSNPLPTDAIITVVTTDVSTAGEFVGIIMYVQRLKSTNEMASLIILIISCTNNHCC